MLVKLLRGKRIAKLNVLTPHQYKLKHVRRKVEYMKWIINCST
jgi:hypothetical protein